MSTKVKERLKKLLLEMTHEERQELDKALEQLMIAEYGFIATKETELPCDVMIEKISDEQLKQIVARIKKKRKKKKQEEMIIEA
jgi:hypothetical protein